MRQVLLYGLALTFCLLAGAARAAGGAGDGKKVEKLKDSHGKVYDLSDPKHLKELQDKLAKGEIEALQADVKKNLLEIRWDLGFWTVIVFILLFLILRKAAWGPMLEGLEKREQNIQLALVEAKEAREEARKLKDELAAERKKGAEAVAEMLAEARRDAEYTKNEMMAKSKAEIQTEKERALREIGMMKDQALHELLNHESELAILVASRAIRKVLSSEDDRRLVNEALTELRQAAHHGNGKKSA